MDKTSPEYRTRYRATLNKLIDDIIAEIPTDIQHISLFSEFRSAKETLAYTAPEILDNSVLALLNILRLYVPWEYDESKNPQWIINIRKIWTTAMDFIDDGLMEKASGPPQTVASEQTETQVAESEG